jgi:hypothetical protein
VGKEDNPVVLVVLTEGQLSMCGGGGELGSRIADTGDPGGLEFRHDAEVFGGWKKGNWKKENALLWEGVGRLKGLLDCTRHHTPGGAQQPQQQQRTKFSMT